MENVIPVPLTPLIDREQDLVALRDTILRAGARLLTLTGPPGVGKTRLSLELARGIAGEFADGVVFIPLASVHQASLVSPAIARALGIRESARPLEDSLVYALQSRQRLLLLDNFEQVSAAGPLLVWLLERAPGLKLLVTSRAALRVSGEYEYSLHPLALAGVQPLPPLDTLASFPSIQLFVQRAQAADQGFELNEENASAVAAICARLDGLPLAIELAAARTRMLAPKAILDRIDQNLMLFNRGDPDARHQNMQHAISWSYDLLDEDEKALFRCLGVFAGSFDLAAVEAICLPGKYEPTKAIELFGQLVDKSLVVVEEQNGEARYRLLETLRQYALDRLEETGEIGGLRRRHGIYFLQLAETASPQLNGSEQILWLDRLEQEHDNLRAALEWSQTEETGEIGLRLVSALFKYWALRGHWEEARMWHVSALARAGSATSLHARATAQMEAGLLSLIAGDLASGPAQFEQSLALFEQAGDRQGCALSLTYLGLLTALRGDTAAALPQLQESVSILRQAGEIWPLAMALFHLGDALLMQDAAAARVIHKESLALFREVGDRWGITLPLTSLGRLALMQGELPAARLMLEEGLALRREMGLKQFVAISLTNLGEVMQLQGEGPQARACYEESLSLAGEVGDKARIAWTLHHLGYLAYHQGDPGRAAALFRQSLDLEAELNHLPGIARCLLGSGVIFLMEQKDRQAAVQAASLFGAAQALLDAGGARMEPVDGREYRAGLPVARARLVPAAFEKARRAGEKMTAQQAIDLARSLLTELETAPAARREKYPAGLTGREVEVLRLIAQGLSNAQAARRLVISQRTVEAHLRSIYKKLDVTNRGAATRFAVENHLV